MTEHYAAERRLGFLDGLLLKRNVGTDAAGGFLVSATGSS